MPETNSSASVPTPISAKEDDQSLLAAILKTVRELANSKLSMWAAIASIVGLLLAVLTLVQGLIPSGTTVPNPPLAPSLEITQPVDGATVGPIIDVYGKAPRDNRKRYYYVIVAPPQGAAQIQAEAMDLSPDGDLFGRAVLGTGSVGVGQTFMVEILASNTAPESLQQAPSDAERSKAIRVIRKY